MGVYGQSCGSVAQWLECSDGVREVLRAVFFFLPCNIWWLGVSVFGLRAAGDSLVGSGTVLSRFGDESIQTGGNCRRSVVWIVQWLECLLGMREVLGSSPGRAVCYFPVTKTFPTVKAIWCDLTFFNSVWKDIHLSNIYHQFHPLCTYIRPAVHRPRHGVEDRLAQSYLVPQVHVDVCSPFHLNCRQKHIFLQ